MGKALTMSSSFIQINHHLGHNKLKKVCDTIGSALSLSKGRLTFLPLHSPDIELSIQQFLFPVQNLYLIQKHFKISLSDAKLKTNVKKQ
jgi:hypothetical protein